MNDKAPTDAAVVDLLSENGFLHTLSHGFSDGIWNVGEDGRTIFANNSLIRMLGRSLDELKAMRLEKLLAPDDKMAILEAIQSGTVVRRGSRRLILYGSNKEPCWYRFEVVPTGSLPGGSASAIILLSETTNQRQGEVASAYLTSLVATSEDAIYGVDLGNLITSWNKGAERMYGYTEDEAIGRDAEFLIPTERPGQIAQLQERIEQGLPVEGMSLTKVRKDGTRIEISLSGTPVFDANDQVVGYSKVARDMTARRKAAETQTWLAAIIDSSDDAIVSKSLSGVIRTWKRGAERIFGYTPEEVIGYSFLRIVRTKKKKSSTFYGVVSESTTFLPYAGVRTGR